MNDAVHTGVAFAANTISILAAMSDVTVTVPGEGRVHITRAMEDKDFVANLIRFGLKAMSGGASWSDDDDSITKNGVPVSMIALAFDFAIKSAPTDASGSVSPSALASLIAEIENADGPVYGYPTIAAVCAGIAAAPLPGGGMSAGV